MTSIVFAQGATVSTPTRCTQQQLQDALVRNGASKSVAKILAAIGMCESPYSAGGVSYSDCSAVGDQALVNDIYWYSYGFFQIRSKRAEQGKGTSRDQDLLPDPDFNCRAAIAVQKSQGYGAWSTYNSGQYQVWLQDLFPVPAGTYRVKSGDSLSAITSRLNKGQAITFDWQSLAYVNGLVSPWVIHIGQSLLLPFFAYTVKAGDNLTTITARQTSGVAVDQVATFNKVQTSAVLSVGQVLQLPRATYLDYLAAKTKKVST